MEFKVLFAYIKVHPGHNLKRQKGFSKRMNINAGRELQQEISSGQDSPVPSESLRNYLV